MAKLIIAYNSDYKNISSYKDIESIVENSKVIIESRAAVTTAENVLKTANLTLESAQTAAIAASNKVTEAITTATTSATTAAVTAATKAASSAVTNTTALPVATTAAPSVTTTAAATTAAQATTFNADQYITPGTRAALLANNGEWLNKAIASGDVNLADQIAWSTTQDKIRGYANGGMASGLSLVGEQGAELVNFSSPANVTSHSQTTGLFDSIGNAIDDQSTLLKEQVVELRALVNLQSNANVALINEMQGMKEELNTISRKAKLEAAA